MSTNDFNNPDPRRDQFPPMENEPDPIVPDPALRPADPLSTTDPLTTVDPLQEPSGIQYGETETGGDSSKAQEAASSAQDLAKEGQQAAGHVVDSAKQEASMIAEQARDKASHLLDELGTDLQDQASQQQAKVAGNLRDISEEFRHMLDSSQATGTASSLVDQAAHHSGRIAEWLDTREPGDLVDEIKSFARRKPAAFLGIALGAGLLAGRITRNAGGPKKSQDQNQDARPRHQAETDIPQGMVQAPPPPALDVDPLPPVQGGTIGQGGVGGTGINPGVADPGTTYPPSTPRRSDFE